MSDRRDVYRRRVHGGQPIRPTKSVRKYVPTFDALETRDLPASLALTSAIVEPDGRTVQLTFTAPLPPKHSFPDWLPGSLAGDKLTTNSGVVLEEIGTYATISAHPAQLTWTATYLVHNSANVITFGASGVTLSASAGLLRDRSGNTSAALTNVAVTNNSLVDSNGFTTQSFQRGNGGVTLYVSSTYGSDSNSFAAAQNPATPYKSLTEALNQLYYHGQNGKGADIKLLRGDTFSTGGQIRVGGQDPQHPFIIEDYWYPYASGATDPGTRPVVAINESAIGPNSALFTSGGGGSPRSISNVVIRDIDFEATNWTGGARDHNGLMFFTAGKNWTLDNDVISNFGQNLGFQGSGNGLIQNVTLLRCIIDDSRYDNSVVNEHSQGVYLDHVTGGLISQSTVDDNGRVSADRTGRDIFSHNIYIQDDSGPAIVWGNAITNGGSHGIQMRSGGVLAYNYFYGDAIAAEVDGPGGAQYKNVVEDMQDISPSQPRGIGLMIGSNFASSVAQTVEGNIIINSQGHQAQGISLDQSGYNGGAPYGIEYGMIRHNTVVSAGLFQFKSPMGQAPGNVLITNADNIYAPGSGLVYSAPTYPQGMSWSWYSADDNDLSSSTANAYNLGSSYTTLSGWQAATGSEANSITTAPKFANGNANLASYAASQGVSGGAASFITYLRNRPEFAWGPQYDMTNLYQYYASAYTPNNLGTPSSGGSEYYGAVNYNTSTGGAGMSNFMGAITSAVGSLMNGL